MLKFQISLTDNFGSLVNFNLKENGDSVTVTKENRAVREFLLEFTFNWKQNKLKYIERNLLIYTQISC